MVYICQIMYDIKINGAKNNLFDTELVSQKLVDFATEEGFKIDRLEYNFVNSEKMYSLNKDFLNHDTDTDIITFDYSKSKTIIAEVFISSDMMIKYASENIQSIENESFRLLYHGLLHCMGYKDNTVEEKAIMRKKEEEFIFAVSRET